MVTIDLFLKPMEQHATDAPKPAPPRTEDQKTRAEDVSLTNVHLCEFWDKPNSDFDTAELVLGQLSRRRFGGGLAGSGGV